MTNPIYDEIVDALGLPVLGPAIQPAVKAPARRKASSALTTKRAPRKKTTKAVSA